MKKICKDCLVEKDIGRFYKSAANADGYRHDCKLCHRRNVAENRAAKAEYYREQMREINARPHHVQKRAEYQRSERGRQANRAATRRYRQFKKLEMRA